MKNIKHAVIMAAGRGTRMLPLTSEMPKAMAEINGVSLISNGIKKLRKEINNIHITVGYKGAMLAKHVIENEVSSVLNTENKGNSWWIFNSLLKTLDEPVLVLTCDNVVHLDIERMAKDYHNLNEPACMVIPVSPVEGLDGDYIFHENNIVKELNRTKISSSYCSGIQVINPFKINKLISPKADFNDLWHKLISLEELKCSRVYPKTWYTIDTLEQLDKFTKNPEGWLP
jgi:NDP-sugar pyrophosphorylase family protein|tara:strand:+ start:156 stop:842 length:687 start_codon:yes stop_codon:yes gene_type:complete